MSGDAEERIACLVRKTEKMAIKAAGKVRDGPQGKDFASILIEGNLHKKREDMICSYVINGLPVQTGGIICTTDGGRGFGMGTGETDTFRALCRFASRSIRT